MRKFKFYFLGMVLALCGCAEGFTPQPVDIPIAVPCKPPAVNVPNFPMLTIPVSAPVDVKVQAALEELYLRRMYENQLVASLKACGG